MYELIKKPNTFLIGFPKCGTTSLSDCLSSHPSVFHSQYKEPHYFSNDLPYWYTKSESQYLKMFSNANSNHRVVMESSTNYIYSSVAIKKILRFNPNSKFIICVRNPSKLILSLHRHSCAVGIENINSLEKALEEANYRDSLRSQANHIDFIKCMISYQYMANIPYFLLRAKNLIPPKQLIVFSLLDNPATSENLEILRVIKFLNLEALDLLLPHSNKKKKLNAGYIDKAIKKVTKLKSIISLNYNFGFLSNLKSIPFVNNLGTTLYQEPSAYLIEQLHNDYALAWKDTISIADSINSIHED